MLFFAFYNELSTPDSYDHFVEIDRPADRKKKPSPGHIFIVNMAIKPIHKSTQCV